MTNDLEDRARRHKAGVGSAFTKRYHITRLVYYERFTDIRQAIEWEKRIKGWDRAKKVTLIQERNPQWLDLAADWSYDDADFDPPPGAFEPKDPSVRLD